MEQLAKQFTLGNTDAIDKVFNFGLWPQIKNLVKKINQQQQLKHYYYLITFTIKPEQQIPDQYQLIEDYIKKQFLRKPLQIIQSHITKEYTKSNIPHWHVAVETTKSLAKNRFNYYQQKFGNIDISKTLTNSIESSLNYINKEQPSIQL